ncbi:MAG TPA: hypothetical protein VNL71_21600 [Chloroflexota bacterium]|nr:hypothetical protein [Chloroflexota bacterium]
MSEPIVGAIKQAEAEYPGGPLTKHTALAERHARMVAQWLVARGANALAPGHTPPPPFDANVLLKGFRVVSTATVRADRGPLRFADGAGVIVLPGPLVLIARDYPLFDPTGLAAFTKHLAIQPLNPLVAWRWSLTDLFLRANAANAAFPLPVQDYSGGVIPIPYAHGFAIGSSALYTLPYQYGQPDVNVGFDAVALKLLSANLSATSSLSYAADVSALRPYAGFLPDLRALLAANRIGPGEWQSLYQTSAVLGAALALIRESKRRFGQDPDPSHLGQNVVHTAYGYGVMKAISQGDSGELRRTLADFTLPSVAPVPTLDPS